MNLATGSSEKDNSISLVSPPHQQPLQDDCQPVDFSIRKQKPQEDIQKTEEDFIDTTNQASSSTATCGTKRKHSPSDCYIVSVTSPPGRGTSRKKTTRQPTSENIMMNLDDTSHFHLHSSGFNNNGGAAGASATTGGYPSTAQAAQAAAAAYQLTNGLHRTSGPHHRDHHHRRNRHHDGHQGHLQPPPAVPQPPPPPSTASEGDYRLTLREELKTPAGNIYQVLEWLGRGTFGQVVKCWKTNTNELYAVKILKNQPSYIRQGQIEVQILNILGKENADDWNFVRAFETFTHHEHTCLVFELLGKNLYDFARTLPENRFKFKQIRPILQQVLRALSKLRQLGLIHADLKPENIMLVNPEQQPCRVKVIDFGSASKVNKDVHQTYLQSRYYRAPEIILGLGFDEKIDMWSLGCVAAELYLGQPLYPGSSEYDQIRFITETQGFPSLQMLRQGEKTHRFFTDRPLTSSHHYHHPHHHQHNNHHQWRLKTQQEYEHETHQASKENRKFRLNDLGEIIQVHPIQSGIESDIEQQDAREFLYMLRRMMVLDPSSRMKPTEALNTPFITMSQIRTSSQYYQDSMAAMEVCGASTRQQQQTLQIQAPTSTYQHPYQQQTNSFNTNATLQVPAVSAQQSGRGAVTAYLRSEMEATRAQFRAAANNATNSAATATGGAAPLYFYGFQSSPHARNPAAAAAAVGVAAAAAVGSAMFHAHHTHHAAAHHHHNPHHGRYTTTAQQQFPLLSQGQLIVPGWPTAGFAAFQTPFVNGSELLRRQQQMLSAGGDAGLFATNSYHQQPTTQRTNNLSFLPTSTTHQQQIYQQQATAINNNNSVVNNQARNNPVASSRRRNNNVGGDERYHQPTLQQPIVVRDSPSPPPSVITISDESDEDNSMVVNQFTPSASSARHPNDQATNETTRQVAANRRTTTAATNKDEHHRAVAAVAPFQQQQFVNQQQRKNSNCGAGGSNLILPFANPTSTSTQHSSLHLDGGNPSSNQDAEAVNMIRNHRTHDVKRDFDAIGEGATTDMVLGGQQQYSWWNNNPTSSSSSGANGATTQAQQPSADKLVHDYTMVNMMRASTSSSAAAAQQNHNRKRQRSQGRQQQRIQQQQQRNSGGGLNPSSSSENPTTTRHNTTTTSSTQLFNPNMSATTAAAQRHAAANYAYLADQAAHAVFMQQLQQQQQNFHHQAAAAVAASDHAAALVAAPLYPHHHQVAPAPQTNTTSAQQVAAAAAYRLFSADQYFQ